MTHPVSATRSPESQQRWCVPARGSVHPIRGAILELEEHGVDRAGVLALAVRAGEPRRVRPRPPELHVLEAHVRLLVPAAAVAQLEVPFDVVPPMVGSDRGVQALATRAEDVRVRGGGEPGGAVRVDRAVAPVRREEEERDEGGERRARVIVIRRRARVEVAVGLGR